jgi:hypothetical protein
MNPQIATALVDQAASYFNIDAASLLDNRARRFSHPRQLVIYTLIEAGFKQADVAAYFQKDHCTISHSCEAIRHYMRKDANVMRQTALFDQMLDDIQAAHFDGKKPERDERSEIMKKLDGLTREVGLLRLEVAKLTKRK